MTICSNFRTAAEWQRISKARRLADAKLLAKGIIQGSSKWYALRDREFRRCMRANAEAVPAEKKNEASTH